MTDTPQKIVDSVCLNFDVAEECSQCYDPVERSVARENLKSAPARIQALIDGATSERDGLIAEMEAVIQSFDKWFYGWCPSQTCCASSGKPIHDLACALLSKVKAMKDKGVKRGED